jgi:dihydrofolate reductase
MTSAIVCVDKNWGIGYDGKLLTYIPEDMMFFKHMTSNSIVIMGRKTYDSLPSKPLPNRVNVVITSKIDRDWKIDENGTVFASMDTVKMYLSFIHPLMPIDYLIIGGGQIYKELLPYCDNAYVTKVDCAYKDVDTYFPNLDKNEEWEMVRDGEEKMYNGLGYKFCIYAKDHSKEV